MSLSQQIRAILSDPLQRLWRKNNCSKPVTAKPLKKKERLIVETLEPRVLLSADFPVIAPILVDNLDQLDDQLEGFFSQELLNIPLPGLAQVDQNTLESYAPSLNDLVSIDATADETSTELQKQRQDLDSNQDGQLTAQEFLSDNLVATVRDLLVDDPTDPNDLNATTGEELTNQLESELEKVVGPFLDVNATYVENPDNTMISLDFQFTNVQNLPIDLGLQAEKLGIVLKSDVEVNSSLGFTLDFGVNDADQSFLNDLNGLDANITANANLDNVDLNLGFLGATVNGGTFNLTATADDTGSEGNFQLHLPVQIKPGIDNLPMQNAVIDIKANLTDLTPIEQRFDFDLNLTTDFQSLITDFNQITPTDVINSLQELAQFLDHLGTTEALVNFDIPFSNSDFSDVLDFADTLADAVLYDDGKDGDVQPSTNENEDNGTRLLDAEHKPTFNTAQEVFEKLSSDIDAVKYDSVKQELTYSLAFSNKLFNVDAPMVFDMDLAPLGNITSNASLQLSGEAGMSLILGISLGEVPGIAFLDNKLPLTVNANPLSSIRITASENVKGLLDSDDTLKETTLTIAGVAVSIQNEDGYGSAYELVRALNEAIAQTELKDQIKIDSQGSRLIITTTENFTGPLTITPNAELGFIAEPGQTIIEGNNHDFIITAQDGTKFGVSLNGQETITLPELQTIIQTATDGRITLEANQDNTALTLTDTQFDATHSNGVLSVTSTNGSASAFLLGIFGTDANVEQGEKADGIIEGNAIAGTFSSDRFFIENAKLWGDLNITTPDGINASANFGFVEIGLTGSGELAAHIETGFKTPGTDTEVGSRVTVSQLMENLGPDVTQVIASPTLTAGLDRNGQNIYGELDLTVSINSSEPWINELLQGSGEPTIKLVVEHFGDPLGIEPNVEDGADPKITVDTSGLDGFALNKFGNFEFDGILDALNAISDDFLSQFESFGFMDEPIPLINQSVNDLIGFANDFDTALQEARSDPAGSLQLLEGKLENALGLAANSNLINLSLDTGSEDILKIELNLETTFAESLNIDIGLGDESSPLNLLADADLNATGGLNLDLDFGIALDDPAKIYLFGTTGLAAFLNIESTNVNFNSQIGPLSFSVQKGSVKLGAGFTAGLTNVTDGRILITDLSPSQHFTADFKGTLANNRFLDSNLPVYMLTDSRHAGDLVINATDFSDISISGWDEIAAGFDFDNMSLLDQALLLVDGIDIFLEGLQDVMDGEIGGISLPFIGDGLEEGIGFIEDFRQGFLEDLRNGIEGAATPDQNFISQQLLELLGPEGLNLLQDSNNDGQKDINDIGLKTNLDESGLDLSQQFMEWDLAIGGNVVSEDFGIDFDLGIPGLGLETQGDINLDIGWNLDFGFGISGTYGVYFKLFDPSKPELRFDVKASLDDAEIIGQLGFLQLAITEDETDPTHLLASFAVDLYKKGDTETKHDTRLSFSELSQLRIAPKIAAEAQVNLDMVLSLNSDMVDEPAVFPQIRADFVLDWSLGDSANSYIALTDVGDTIQDGLKLIEFQNVSLDLGSYISDFVAPILEQIQSITEPLQPLVDILTDPLPVISDLGPEVSLLDIAELYLYASGSDLANEVPFGFIESVADIIDLVNSIKTDYDELWVPFGDFVIFDQNSDSDMALTDPNLELSMDQFASQTENANTFDDRTTRSGDREGSDSAGFFDKLRNIDGFGFPILTKPGEIFNLLLGKEATLITYDMKPLKFGFEYSQFFPLPPMPIIGVRIGGSLEASIDFDFGFDTHGIQKFVESDFINPGLIFSGFFVDETVGGKDHPELMIQGALKAAAELNLAIAKAGVSGGVYATVNFDLYDPNFDGKVRVDEILNSIDYEWKHGNQLLSPMAAFDIYGDISAQLEWYIDTPIYDKEGVFVDPISLWEFTVPFDREPILASDLGDGVLQLNMGDLADQRLNGDTTDGDEVFTLTDTGSAVKVEFNGNEEEYDNIDKVVIRAGAGNDIITLEGSSDLEFDIKGGVGNDEIDVSGTSGKVIIHGDAGDDLIKTGRGDDWIWGDAGNDEIHAGGGIDWVFGDSGKIKEGDNGVVEYIKVRTNGTDGEDTIKGGIGDDILIGGGELDQIHGGNDADLILGDKGTITFSDENPSHSPTQNDIVSIQETERGLEGGNDVLNGDSGTDTIYGGIGNDEISGGDDTDVIFGEKGADTLHGDKGVDYIFGGDDGDKIFGGDDGDFLYGNDGGDEIYGDSGSDEIYGGRGADILHGNDHDDTIYGGSDPDLIYGDAGNDILDGEAGNDTVFGYDGTYASLSEAEKIALTQNLDLDQITSSLGNDVLDGEGQGDLYIINLSGGDTTKHVTAFDTGRAEDGADKMVINSTTDDSENEADKNDRFLLRAEVAQDTIAFVAMLNGTEDVERIDYDHHIEAMVINSFAGDDYFALDDNRAVTTINGGAGQDTFQVGQMFATPRTVEEAHILPHDGDKPHDGSLEVGTDIFATIETTRGFLSNGVSEATTINGGDDNDTFTVFHNKAVLGLKGGDGNDEFTIRSFALSGSQEVTRERTDLSGGADADLIQYAVNAPVNIDGGDGLDEIRLIGTEFSDDFVVTSKGVFGAGLSVNFVNVELLKVDGAEGDDRFFIQSTDANLVTQLIGGLGSDSFNVGGDAPPIISNDLLGHSGIISHSVVSEDPAYNDIQVEGISANIADNDEPGIVINQSDGSSIVNSAGIQDAYTVVLTQAPAPGEIVVVTALAPTKEDERALIQFDVNGELQASHQLVFDSTNWNVPQTVSFIANSYAVSPDESLISTINHTISSEDSLLGTINGASNAAPTINLDQAVTADLDLTGATIKITDGLGKGQIRGIEVANGSILELRTAWNIVPDASSVYEITLADGQTAFQGQILNAANNTTVSVNGGSFGLENAGGDLRGATLQIIGGAGAGQERLIMSNTTDTLVVNKPWTTPLDNSSEFQILRYSAVQAPSVDVYINEGPKVPVDTTQTPGVKVTQTAGSTDVIEGLNTDTYSLQLTQQPTADVKVYVEPEPTITTRGQIFAKEAQVAVAGASLQSDENGQFVVFTPDNWIVAQTITVTAIDDGFVDGSDTQVFAPMPQIINPVQGPLYMEGMGESEISIGSINNPLMLPGETNQKAALGNVIAATTHNITVETQNIPEKYGDLVDYTLEITAGEGKGQARIITGYNPDTGVIALDHAWETLPNQTSQFTLSTTNPNLLVDETEQVDVVTVFNNDSVTDDVGVLTENRLSGFGMGDQIVLEGTTFQGGINYFEMENFTANLGKGDNQLTINGTHTRDDGFRTVTLINAGQGDDAINVNLDDQQGFIAIKGETGNDNIDASDSELGIIAFGDEGDDHLTGGTGKDTLLGDLGRIDYLNEDEEVVTRLGLPHDFNTMFAVPQHDDETPADQTDGVDRSPTVILSLHEEIGGIDQITGSAGDDLIIGGSGTDNIDGSEHNDIVLGDNGFVNFDPDGRINTVSTMTPLQGSRDIINGGAGHDLIFAGTGDDYVQGDSDNDLIFGDHGRAVGNVDLSTLPLATLTPAFEFEAIDTQITDGGGNDTIRGGSGEDILLGQQGADLIYGGQDDDDLIGGHNVKGGHDTGDRMGGGQGDDVIAGDNAIIERRGDTLSLLTQTLTGTTLYNADGVAQITGGRHADPAGTQIRNITLLDHSDTTQQGVYGDDYIVGSADNDVIFGQLGNDKLQGDGNLANPNISASIAPDGRLSVTAAVEAETDGNDYIEGNGGDDLIAGNLGQDDIIGGNSNLFGLEAPHQRPDGADLIFGGAETRIDRNDPGFNGQMGHSRDADVILGDNANIFQMADADDNYIRFNHDLTQQRIVRTYELLDYTLGGGPQDIGTGDELHGEGGDDILHGMTGNDVLFGEGQDDDLYGGSGHDRLYGGTGVDGALGDDGLIYTSRNGTAEPLYGITTANHEGKISIPGPVIGAIIYPDGQLNKSVELLAYDQGATGNGNDVIYGGLGHDYLHGGEGDDAISGAEAMAAYYHSQPHTGTVSGNVNGQIYSYQVDTPLPFTPTGTDPERGQFDAYDANDPRTKIAGFLLNFDAVDAKGHKIADGSDRIFGDLGHDWLVGGTENDRLFGGWGNDLMNADDNLESNNGLNNTPDSPEFADGDFVFGGAGLDVMIANTGKDRMFDWSGEFNSYIVPFSPFGAPTNNRAVSPHIENFLIDLGLAGGADTSLTEPYGELGLVTSADSGLWQDQKGSPRDPQPGNLPGVQRDTRGTPEWIDDNGGNGNTPTNGNQGGNQSSGNTPTNGNQGGNQSSGNTPTNGNQNGNQGSGNTPTNGNQGGNQSSGNTPTTDNGNQGGNQGNGNDLTTGNPHDVQEDGTTTTSNPHDIQEDGTTATGNPHSEIIPEVPIETTPVSTEPEPEVPTETTPDTTEPEVPLETTPDTTEPEVPIETTPDTTEPEVPIETTPDTTEPEVPIETTPDTTEPEVPIETTPDTTEPEKESGKGQDTAAAAGKGKKNGVVDSEESTSESGFGTDTAAAKKDDNPSSTKPSEDSVTSEEAKNDKGKSDKETKESKNNSSSSKTRSAGHDRANIFEDSKASSDILLFDETTGAFVESNAQAESDDDFLMIGKGDTSPSGATGLIAW